MRGISFMLPNKYDKFLWRILREVDVDKYDWYVFQYEVLYFDNDTQKVRVDLFEKEFYSAQEFCKTISEKDYLVISANIQAYPVGSLKTQISSYEDFIKSSCEVLFLCADSVYADIYCKQKELTQKLYEMCVENGFSEVEFITDENDTRTRLSI